jgi:hypothetical protein
MDVIICPGTNKVYRVALVDDAGSFQPLSEHDAPEHAMAAQLLARSAQDRAVLMLNKIFKECVR